MTTGRFDIEATSIPGLSVVRRHPADDTRGSFERLYEPAGLTEAGLSPGLAQVNRSWTRQKGTVRGLHFQYPPPAEAKLVSCLRGEVFDVAVDLRRGSSTFLRWHGEILSASNHRSLLVPAGFAHGFQAMTDDCELLYLHTAAYRPGAEGGVNALDPRLAIAWPLPPDGLSARDRGHAFLSDEFEGLPI